MNHFFQPRLLSAKPFNFRAGQSHPIDCLSPEPDVQRISSVALRAARPLAPSTGGLSEPQPTRKSAATRVGENLNSFLEG